MIRYVLNDLKKKRQVQCLRRGRTALWRRIGEIR